MESGWNGLEELSSEECLRLLRSRAVGRIGLSADALPMVLPVNYVVSGDHILFRTRRDTTLSTATRNAVVAFEVDEIEPASGCGWSVVVRGLAHEISDPELLEAARQAPLARWWNDTDDSRHVSVSIDLISGRRVDSLLESEGGPEASDTRSIS